MYTTPSQTTLNPKPHPHAQTPNPNPRKPLSPNPEPRTTNPNHEPSQVAPECSAQAIANIVWALGSMELLPDAMLQDALEDRAAVIARDLTPQVTPNPKPCQLTLNPNPKP